MSLPRQNEYALSRQTPPSPAGAGGLPVDATAYLPRLEPWRMIGMLLRRWWIIALSVVVLLGAAFAYLRTATRVYEAKGSVYISSKAPRVIESGAVAPEETKDLEQMRSVEQGLVSATLLGRVIDAAGLADDPSFTAGAQSRQQLIGSFSKKVAVELRRGTRLIDVSVKDTDPQRAKRLVELIVEEYGRWTAEMQGGITRQVADGIRKEEQGLRERMEQSERRLQDFRNEHPIPGISQRDGRAGDDLGRIEAELTRAKSERMRLEAELSALKKFNPAEPESASALATGDRGASISALVRALQQKELEFDRVKERYLHKHPTYKEVASEVEGLRRNLEQAAKTATEVADRNYLVAKDNEAKLSGEAERVRRQTVEAEGLRARFETLEREAIADRTTYDAVAARLRETTIAAAVPASALRWEDSPMVPEKPVKPSKPLVMGLALFGGLFLGLLAAVGLELADGRIRDSAAAARATSSPLLATIHPVSEGSAGEMLLFSQPGSDAAEGFRRLRAAIAPAPGQAAPATILFASARAGEGRSFCAMNYAVSLAMQGMRTLLLDADMRRPGLSFQHLQSAEGKIGLSDYLAGSAEPAKACYPTTLPNLYLLASGSMQASAAELLSGTRFPALLEEAHRWFDCVVIDTPALLSASDALAITRYADRTCLVVRERAADRRELRRVAEQIRTSGGNLCGFVWNETVAKTGQINDAGPSMPVVRPMLASSSPVSIPSARRSLSSPI